MIKNSIFAKAAPSVVGPYSQAIEIDGFIFCSGQIPVDPESGSIIKGGIEEFTAQVLENLSKVLHGAGASLSDVIKTTVFMTDLSEFEKMNKVYEGYFKKPYPARSTIQVVKLPKGARIEIEAVANIK